MAISWTWTLPATSADQAIGCGTLVLDGEVAAGDFRAARRGAAPCLRDHEIADFHLFGARRRGQHG
jgi:hypothetical protein